MAALTSLYLMGNGIKNWFEAPVKQAEELAKKQERAMAAQLKAAKERKVQEDATLARDVAKARQKGTVNKTTGRAGTILTGPGGGGTIGAVGNAPVTTGGVLPPNWFVGR